MIYRLIAFFLRRGHFRLSYKMDNHLARAHQAAEQAAAVAVSHEQATQAHITALTKAMSQAHDANEQVQNVAKSMAEKAEAIKPHLES